MEVLAISFLLVFVQVSLGEGCSDNSNECADWKSKGFCKPLSKYFLYMKDECKVTCGFCMPVLECKDASEDCPNWKKDGYCEKDSLFHDYMTVNCRKTCGFCGSMPIPAPATTTTKKPETLAPTAPAVCKDSSDDCAGWKIDGYCEKGSQYYKYMKDTCPRTCGFCKPIFTELPIPLPATTTPGPPIPVTTQPADCKDKSDYCRSYKPYCNDPDYIEYVKKECKRTCHYCWVTTQPPPTTKYVSTQLYTGSGGRKIQPNCGNKEKHHTRIVGGKNAKPGSWPWQVGMDWSKNVDNPGHLCGGTLITEEWVITAAHCFVHDTDKDNYWIILGQHDIHHRTGREQFFNISELIIHPKYNKDNQDYDMVLLKLKGKAKLNNYVRTACLPGQNTTFATGTKCYITGWGLLEEGGDAPAILQQAKVPLVNREKCQKAYKAVEYVVTPRMFCAGYDGGKIDSCSGDSGGPLTCMHHEDGKEVWYLWGTISWGVGCARKKMYGVLSSPKILRPWIDSIVFKGV